MEPQEGKPEDGATGMLTPCWRLAHGRSLVLGQRGRLMAILNVTPDSFSDGGRYATRDAAVEEALRMAGEGADIIDVGGESTRPGAAPVGMAEEQDRVLPVIERLARESDVLVSVDTYRAETARLAIAAGAHIINDVHGLQKEPAIADVAARTCAGLCIMHTGREREKRADVIEDQLAFFERSLAIADEAGLAREAIVLDPGFGFAKETTEENLELMARLPAVSALGYPLLIGTSRKRFLGALTGREAAGRDIATAATTTFLRLSGAHVFRVHDIPANRDALAVADALIATRNRLGDLPQ